MDCMSWVKTMVQVPRMNLVPRSDRPSIWIDRISGLEFTDHGRDSVPPYQEWYCMKFGKFICEARTKRIGLIETPSGPVLKFVVALPQLRKNFERSQKFFSRSERADIGTFERCLPLMLEAWRRQKISPGLIREGGRVEIELSNLEKI